MVETRRAGGIRHRHRRFMWRGVAHTTPPLYVTQQRDDNVTINFTAGRCRVPVQTAEFEDRGGGEQVGKRKKIPPRNSRTRRVCMMSPRVYGFDSYGRGLL